MNDNWILTDDDCDQYMKVNNNTYNFIQLVWLDTTIEDKQNNMPEYVVVQDEFDFGSIEQEQINLLMSLYSYDEQQEDDIIAECYFETFCVNGSNIIGEFNERESAEKFIKEYIDNH